jgi:uncharacterized protein (DUF305 family)
MVLGAAVTVALLLAVAPTTAVSGRAQMGPMSGPSLDQLSGEEFEKAFLQQMIVHHTMAVMMARPLRQNAQHQELKDLHDDIAEAQTREIAQMRSWAREWYGLEIPDHLSMMDAMPGQGHGQAMPGHAMPGMGPTMSGMPMHGDMPMMDDMSMMADLWKLPSNRLEVVFMSLMIPHHQGAIDMARLVPDRAAHQELKDLATDILQTQAAEIDQMNGWLGTWYGL